MPDQFVDFAALKQSLSMEKVIDFLGLKITHRDNPQQWRAACPHCQKGGERILSMNTAQKVFTCFVNPQTRGDVIGLVAHVRGIGQRAAAELMQRELMGNSTVQNSTRPARGGNRTSTPRRREPQEERQERQKDSPSAGLAPLDYLDPAHEAVEALGLMAEDAEAIGAGYASKGIMRGLVAVPIRLPTGELAGYIGLPDDAEIRLPSKWHGIEPPKVVRLHKRRA